MVNRFHSPVFFAPDEGGTGDGTSGAGDGTTGDGTGTTGAAGTGSGDGTSGAGDGSAGDGDLGEAGQRALAAERTARKTAERALAKLERDHMTEQQKLVDDAKKESRTSTLKEVGGRLVDSEVRGLAAGRGLDVDALLEGLDRSRFLDDDGEPKSADIKKWLDKLAPEGNGNNGGGRFPDLGQGARSTTAAAGSMNDLIRGRMRP